MRTTENDNGLGSSPLSPPLGFLKKVKPRSSCERHVRVNSCGRIREPNASVVKGDDGVLWFLGKDLYLRYPEIDLCQWWRLDPELNVVERERESLMSLRTTESAAQPGEFNPMM